ncbi:MAG: gliding motility-associated C-terminal domain-containing protein, partial [Flavobacteriaceae bacterium]
PIETRYSDPLSIISIDIKNSSCYGADDGSIEISVKGGVKFDSTSTEYIFNWEGYNTAGDIIYRQNAEDVYNLPPGKYSLTITDAVGCQLGPIEYEINEPDQIKITHNIQDIDCDNPYGKVDFNITGGLAPYEFKLFYLDPVEDRKVEIQDISNYYNVRDLKSGIYIFEVSDRYCKQSKTFEIKDLTDLKIDKVNISSQICSLEPGFIYIETVTNSNNPQLSFYFNDLIINSENISKVSSNRYRLYIAEPQEQFVLKIGDNLGCFSQEYFVDTRIEISEITYTSEMFEKTGEYRVNDPIVFNTNYIIEDIPRVEDNLLLYDFVTWDFGDFGFKKFTFIDNQQPNEDNESINQVFHSYTANGVYEVSHKVYSIYGCFEETKFTIRVGSGYEIIIPNAFTPNNDGINDYFRPVVSGIESLSIQIYDQWGNVVHFSNWEMNSLDATWGWNGVENKQSTPTSGTYNYNVVAKTIDGETVTRYGSVFIIK